MTHRLNQSTILIIVILLKKPKDTKHRLGVYLMSMSSLGTIVPGSMALSILLDLCVEELHGERFIRNYNKTLPILVIDLARRHFERSTSGISSAVEKFIYFPLSLYIIKVRRYAITTKSNDFFVVGSSLTMNKRSFFLISSIAQKSGW